MCVLCLCLFCVFIIYIVGLLRRAGRKQQRLWLLAPHGYSIVFGAPSAQAWNRRHKTNPNEYQARGQIEPTRTKQEHQPYYYHFLHFTTNLKSQNVLMMFLICSVWLATQWTQFGKSGLVRRNISGVTSYWPVFDALYDNNGKPKTLIFPLCPKPPYMSQR